MPHSSRTSLFDVVGRHPIHPFPARMAPGIAMKALGDDKRLHVLDPMAGSGTVLAVARARGHVAHGFDLDPLAVVLAGVWTTSINVPAVNKTASAVLERSKRLFASMPSSTAYPIGSDEETKEFIRYWFDAYARRQLTALSRSIRGVRDSAVRNALWCGFSRLIITKSAGASRAMDLSHSRPHREFETAPIKPFRRFLRAVAVVTSNCLQSGAKELGPRTHMKLGDARKLALGDESIDLVLTSPPYLNAIDYMRCSKFSLVWMGHTVRDLRSIRTTSVGAESASPQPLDAPWVQQLLSQLRLRPSLAPREAAILARYVWDMGRAIAEVSRVLRAGGRAVYVVGDCNVRGTFIPNSRIVEALATLNGLTLVTRSSRTLPERRRYLPAPEIGRSEQLDGRLRQEVVLGFRKG